MADFKVGDYVVFIDLPMPPNGVKIGMGGVILARHPGHFDIGLRFTGPPGRSVSALSSRFAAAKFQKGDKVVYTSHVGDHNKVKEDGVIGDVYNVMEGDEFKGVSYEIHVGQAGCRLVPEMTLAKTDGTIAACTCDLWSVLMVTGCKCGFLAQERAKQS